MVYAIVSVILYLLAFPLTGLDFSLWPLAFIALVPYFISLDRTDSVSAQFAFPEIWGKAGIGESSRSA